MKLKKWQWALVVIIPVGIIGLAVAVYLLKTPPQFPGTPNFWDLVFDFLDKWASAGAPAMTLLAVLAALWIGISGIRETRDIQRKERDERLRFMDLDGRHSDDPRLLANSSHCKPWWENYLTNHLFHGAMRLPTLPIVAYS